MDFANLFDNLGEHTVNGLSKGSIYALVALGYTLVYGVLRLINFAHSEVFMVGTWAVLGVYTWLGVTGASSWRHDRWRCVLGLVGGCGRLGRHGADRRAGRLPTTSEEERTTTDLPDHRDRLLAGADGALRLRASRRSSARRSAGL